MEHQLRCVFVASGEMQAQQVRAFLEASGIATVTRGEALRRHGCGPDARLDAFVVEGPE